MDDEPGDDEDVICSAKGCRQQARHVLVWNNPKLHTTDREKTWVACDEHRASLSSFLDVRGFLTRVEPVAAPYSGGARDGLGGQPPGLSPLR